MNRRLDSWILIATQTQLREQREICLSLESPREDIPIQTWLSQVIPSSGESRETSSNRSHFQFSAQHQRTWEIEQRQCGVKWRSGGWARPQWPQQKVSRPPLIRHKMILLHPFIGAAVEVSGSPLRKYSLGVNTKTRAVYSHRPPFALFNLNSGHSCNSSQPL